MKKEIIETAKKLLKENKLQELLFEKESLEQEIKRILPKHKEPLTKRIENGKQISKLVLKGEGSFSLGEVGPLFALSWKSAEEERRVLLDNFGFSCDCPDRFDPCKHKIALMLLVSYVEKKALTQDSSE